MNRLIKHDKLIVEIFFVFAMLNQVCFVLLYCLFQSFVFTFEFEYLLFLLKELIVLLGLYFGWRSSFVVVGQRALSQHFLSKTASIWNETCVSYVAWAFIVYNRIFEILVWWKPSSLILFHIHSAVIIALWTFEDFGSALSFKVLFELSHLHETWFKVVFLLWVIVFNILQNRRFQSITLDILVDSLLRYVKFWAFPLWR